MTEGRLTRAGARHDIELFADREAAFLSLVRERNVFVEVKSDQRTRDTGNVFVEYAQDTLGCGIWKASGIAASDADYWVEEFDEDCWIVVPPRRIRILVKHWARRGRKRRGGDFNHHKGVIVPVASIVYPLGSGVTTLGGDHG